MWEKYLTPSNFAFTFTPTDDIGEVALNIDATTPYNKIASASVGGVERVTKNLMCLTCKEKVVAANAVIGRCSVCNMSQRLDSCTHQLSARLLIIHDDPRTSLLAFLPAIQAITNDNTISFHTDPVDIEFQLLLSGPFTLKYNHSKSINRH